MYKLYLVFILLFVACSTNKKYQAKNDSNSFLNSSKNISNVLFEQTNQWNRGSIDGFMKGYWHSDSLKFITKRGIKFGYDSVANSYKRNYNSLEKMGNLTFKNIRYYKTDNAYNVIQATGNWHVLKTNAADSGMFSLLFKQFNGEWKIIVDHTW